MKAMSQPLILDEKLRGQRRVSVEGYGRCGVQFLVGVTDAPTLAEALNQLCAPQPVAGTQPAKRYTLTGISGLSPEEQAILQLA